MTEDQLKLLRSARPSGKDEHDPAVAEAREAAARMGDEVVTRLAAEKQADLEMQASLRNVQPPPGLETSILTAMRAARGIGEPPEGLKDTVLTAVRQPPVVEEKVIPISRRRWLGQFAAAAAVVTAGGFLTWRRFGAFSVDSLTEELVEMTRNGISLALMSPDKDAVAAWLRENKAPRLKELPTRLDELGRKGCQLFEIDGHPVSLECLLLADMSQLHLYSTPLADLAGTPSNGAPAELRYLDGFTVATWAREDQMLVMLSHEPQDFIRGLLV